MAGVAGVNQDLDQFRPRPWAYVKRKTREELELLVLDRAVLETQDESQISIARETLKRVVHALSSGD
jgi:hypothetical protein